MNLRREEKKGGIKNFIKKVKKENKKIKRGVG